MWCAQKRSGITEGWGKSATYWRFLNEWVSPCESNSDCYRTGLLSLFPAAGITSHNRRIRKSEPIWGTTSRADTAVQDLEPKHHPAPHKPLHFSAHVPTRDYVMKQDYPVLLRDFTTWWGQNDINQRNAGCQLCQVSFKTTESPDRYFDSLHSGCMFCPTYIWGLWSLFSFPL